MNAIGLFDEPFSLGDWAHVDSERSIIDSPTRSPVQYIGQLTLMTVKAPFDKNNG